MSYIVEADLDRFLGDVLLASGFDKQPYIDDALAEMEIKLGEEYATPLPLAVSITDARTLSTLKFIQARIAAGQIITYQAGTSGDERLSEYGTWLLEQARERIRDVTSPTNVSARLQGIDSFGPNSDTGDSSAPPGALGPRIINADADSPVENYYSFLAGGNCTRWYTG